MEVIVVIALFAVAMIGLVSLVSSIQVAQRSSTYLDTATDAARNEVELIRDSQVATITDGTSFTASLPTTLPTGSTGTVAVSTPVGSLQSKQIDVTVSYPVGTLTKKVTISAYINPAGGF